MIRAALILGIAAAAISVIIASLGRHTPDRDGVAALLTETNPPAGFSYALEPRPFRFPADHGEHPDYRSEWWYFTGNLDAGERAFGFQLTVFRFALRPGSSASASPWRSNQVYLGHFALSDVAADRFHNEERRARPALGRAGVGTGPVAVWIDDWRIEQTDARSESWRLVATMPGASIDLALQAERPVVAQGDRGLSKKSAAPGNASYYYSIPRLGADGTVGLDGSRHAVTGTAWFDHEWSTSALAEGQRGWDWFALQLEDGRDLMFYQIRGAAGRADPASHGVLVDADGSAIPLRPDQLELTTTGYWRSPVSGARYPARWQIRIPDFRVTLDVRPKMAAQEWHENFTYWEGAVSVDGVAGGRPLSGQGYVELVGYDTTR